MKTSIKCALGLHHYEVLKEEPLMLAGTSMEIGKVIVSRIRKCINYIRINGMVPHLIANSKGYFVATSVEEVETYCESLKGRAEAIFAMRQALQYQLNGKLFL